MATVPSGVESLETVEGEDPPVSGQLGGAPLSAVVSPEDCVWTGCAVSCTMLRPDPRMLLPDGAASFPCALATAAAAAAAAATAAAFP